MINERPLPFLLRRERRFVGVQPGQAVPDEHAPPAAVEGRGRVPLAQQPDEPAGNPDRQPDRLDARVLRAQAEGARDHPAPAGDHGEHVSGLGVVAGRAVGTVSPEPAPAAGRGRRVVMGALRGVHSALPRRGGVVPHRVEVSVLGQAEGAQGPDLADPQVGHDDVVGVELPRRHGPALRPSPDPRFMLPKAVRCRQIPMNDPETSRYGLCGGRKANPAVAEAAQPTRVLTALVSSARAALASAKYMLVLGLVYSSLSMPAYP